MTIENGDLVKYKLGGTLMYVINADDPNAIRCSWTAGDHEPDKTDTFHSENLTIVEKQTKLRLRDPYRERMS